MHKATRFQWNNDCEWSFQELKNRLTLVADHKSLQHVFKQKELNLKQRRWFKQLKNYDVDILYHLGKVNVIVDSLSRKSMGSLKYVETGQLEMTKDMHQLANLSGWFLDVGDEEAIVQNVVETSLVAWS